MALDRLGQISDDPDQLDEVGLRYRQQEQEFSSRHARALRRDWNLTIARGVVFLIGAFLATICYSGGLNWWILLVPFGVFLLLAAIHERTIQQLSELAALKKIYQQHLARVQRRWAEFPVPEVETRESHSAIIRDLDLLGRGSVFQWLCVAHTPMGKSRLLDWLLEPSTTEEVAERQRWVRALAKERAWRELLQLHGTMLQATSLSTTGFLQWCTEPLWLERRKWLLPVARLVPVITLLTIAATSLGWLSAVVGLSVIAILMVNNLVLCFLYTGEIHEIFLSVSGRTNQAGHYAEMLKVGAELPDIVGNVSSGGSELRSLVRRGYEGLGRLESRLRFVAISRALFFGLIHLILQIAILWEVHLLAWLEQWQRRWGREAPQWFSALGQLEALASLATVADEHPDWTFARIDPQAVTVRAIGLGHPLLNDRSRVVNDVDVGPPGSFLLVTGSNMSGKSTLLRSIGVNALLANAGGVVCAREFVVPLLDVQTCIRISDSLTDGVSLFLAELLRMKSIVDRACQQEQSPRRLLYLLDEILQGTNSRERRIAVIRVLGHLLKHQAIGAISTHDLELASTPELEPFCRVVHFRESFVSDGQRRSLTFDYKMRSGVSPTTNALILLDLVGLPSSEATEPHEETRKPEVY